MGLNMETKVCNGNRIGQAKYQKTKAGKATSKRYYKRHRERVIKRVRHYYERHPEKRRKDALWAKYRLTIERYDQMLVDQNGACAICGMPQSELKHRLKVDHNHATTKIRGLLCSRCNNGLGYLEGWAIEFSRRIEDYLGKS